MEENRQTANSLELSLETIVPDFSKVTDMGTPEGFSAAIVLLLLGIFLFGLFFALKEFVASRARVGELEALVKDADRESLAERRRELRQRAETDTRSGKLWREFDESLVLIESRSRLFNTIDAPHFFNTHTLARGLTENRLLAAMPGILTAIGVVGTFAGLQMGLAALSGSVSATAAAGGSELGEVESLKQGIFAMISGASIAFMTSLWGVALSVSFNFLEKLLERFARAQISGLQNTIDFLYPRVTAEQSLVNIEESSLQSKETLAGLDEKIGHRLQEAMSQAADTMKASISESLQEVLAPAIDKLVNNAHQGSEKALDGLMNEFMSKVGAAGEEQQQALINTTSAVQSASSEINRGVEELIGRLESFLAGQDNIADSFQGVAKANEQASGELRTAAANLKEGADSLSEHTQMFASTGQQLGDAVSSAVLQLDGTTNALSVINESQQRAIGELRHVYSEISELDDRLKSVSVQAGSDMRAIQENTASVLEVLREQMNVFEGRMTAFSQQQQTALEQTTATVAQASSGVTGQVDSLLEKVSATLQNNLESAETFRGIADANSSAANQLVSVASVLAESAKNLAGHNQNISTATGLLTEATSSAASRIQDAGRLMGSVSESQQTATNQISQLTQRVQEVSTQMVAAGEKADQGLTRVSQHFDSVSDSMKQHIVDLETQLAKLLSEYSSQVQTQTTDRLNVWNTQTQEYVGAMSDAVQALAGVVDEIERGQSSNRGTN